VNIGTPHALYSREKRVEKTLRKNAEDRLFRSRKED
jgi:hypothetical protein